MAEPDDWRKRFRPDIPSPARIYNYFLGGKDHYPADRAAAEQVLAVLPTARVFALENRAFLRRAVRFLAADCGIRQFIDIGTGLPAEGNVHEVAQRIAPDARVAYVDNDPVVLAHGRDMLHGVPGTAIVEHDLRRPAEILANPELRRLIDFHQPVALLLVAVLHFVPDCDDPAGIVHQLIEPFPPGSYVALTHGTSDARPAETEAATRIYDEATATAHARSGAEIMAMVAGMELVEPGMVWAPTWRPEPEAGPATDPTAAEAYAMVARKP